MDKLTGLMGGASSGGQQQQQQQQAQNPAAPKEDYVDKGLDALEKRFGVDSQKNRSMNEKITDGAREQFEKMTGKKIPDKFSN